MFNYSNTNYILPRRNTQSVSTNRPRYNIVSGHQIFRPIGAQEPMLVLQRRGTGAITNRPFGQISK